MRNPLAVGATALALVAGAAGLAGAGPVSAAPTSAWTVTYDPSVPAAARPAVQRAVDAWAAAFSSDQTVRVAVGWGPRPASPQPVLGAAGDMVLHAPDTGVLYPVALEEAVEHTDLNAGGPDVTLDIDSTTPWTYDPAAPSPTAYDLGSYAMRGLGAGLGLSSGLLVAGAGSPSGAIGTYGSDDDGNGRGDGSYWPVYDSFVSSALPYRAAVTDYDNKTSALAAALTSGRLTWSGPLAAAANAGRAPVLASPPVWSADASTSFLDEATYPAGSPDALMTPVIGLGEVIRTPGSIAPAMLRDLVQSPYAAGAPVRHYVNALYNSFLMRDADPTGLPFWTGHLVVGDLTRLQLTSSLSTSQEYVSVQVSQLYNDVLGRAPDAAGLAFWIAKIQGGLPIATVGASFYASDENFAQAGGAPGAPGPWIDSLYRALLGRASDPNGKAFWVTQTRQQGRLYVTTNFYGSAETLARRVNNLYLSLLDRDADPTGLAFWPAVVRDRGDLALAATLATSEEYYLRADDLPLPAR